LFAFASPIGTADTRCGLTSLTRRDGAASRTDYAAWLRDNELPRHN